MTCSVLIYEKYHLSFVLTSRCVLWGYQVYKNIIFITMPFFPCLFFSLLIWDCSLAAVCKMSLLPFKMWIIYLNSEFIYIHHLLTLTYVCLDMPGILSSSNYRSSLNSGCFFSRFITALFTWWENVYTYKYTQTKIMEE